MILIVFSCASNALNEYGNPLSNKSITTLCAVNTRIGIEDVERKNTPISKEDRVHEKLLEIIRAFNIPNAKYTLMSIEDERVPAVSHYQKFGSRVEPVLTINQKYINSSGHSNALTWVLAHELFHHLNGDLNYSNSLITSNNHKKELLADERAGFALGLLNEYPYLNLDYLKKFTNENNTHSHPSFIYRKTATLTGIMKTMLSDESDIDTVSHNGLVKAVFSRDKEGSETYAGIFYLDVVIHVKYSDGSLYFRHNERFSDQETEVYITWTDNQSKSGVFYGKLDLETRMKQGQGEFYADSGESYFGNYKDNLKSGKGKLTLSDGSTYEGNFHNDKFHGYGILFDSSHKLYYKGTFEQGLKHGDGILYRRKIPQDPKSSQVIKAGCWYKGRYVGVECDH
ncbi:MAG: hypothetical protein Roseis2KO_47870 [Roseivirga sp.]